MASKPLRNYQRTNVTRSKIQLGEQRIKSTFDLGSQSNNNSGRTECTNINLQLLNIHVRLHMLTSRSRTPQVRQFILMTTVFLEGNTKIPNTRYKQKEMDGYLLLSLPQALQSSKLSLRMHPCPADLVSLSQISSFLQLAGFQFEDWLPELIIKNT